MQQLVQAAILLVGVDILKAGKMLHLREQDRPPVREILHVVRLDRVLIERVAAASADAQILGRLQKRRGTGSRLSLGRRRLMMSGALILRSVQRLERHIDEAGIVAPCPRVKQSRSPPPDRFDDVDESLDRRVHHGKGRILRPLHAAHDALPCPAGERSPSGF